MKNIILQFIVVTTLVSCNSKNTERVGSDVVKNPPSEGFNLNGSDQKAIEIADKVMEAQGGRKAWDELEVVSWNFFGARDLVWNKMTGDVRIESPRDSTTYILNIHSMEGNVSVKGQLVSDSTKTNLLKRAKSIWINDSYWLFMPFKLKDSGVTLKYVGTDTTMVGANSDVLSLTFEGVGDTPQNKYEVWVDQSDNLIKQWAFFRNSTQDSASFIRPWDNYQKYGQLKLSADRSDDSGPRDVRVFNKVPDNTFTSTESISL